MPKRRRSRIESDSDGATGPGSIGDSGSRDPAEFHDGDKEGDDPFQQSENNQGGNNLGSCSFRQGSNEMFPCDINMLTLTGDQESKVLAVNVAISVCEGLHSWAETSSLNCMLQRLRHLLCLVNRNGDNALHTAIQNQQWEPFKKILETVDTFPDISYLVNEPNLRTMTPLALAVSTNRLRFVKELISHNADISITNFDEDNPLHMAIKLNNLEIVKSLLTSKNTNSIIDKCNHSSMTALHLAALKGNLEIVKLLCNHKATFTQDGKYGRTPLHLAVEKEEIGNILCTLHLLKAAGDSDIVNIQNYKGDTALHRAASLGHTKHCALLLHFGSDLSIQNYIRPSTEEGTEKEQHGQTALQVAANDEVRNILNGTPEDCEKVYHAFSAYIVHLSLDEQESNETNIFTADSSSQDSGIDITGLHIS